MKGISLNERYCVADSECSVARPANQPRAQEIEKELLALKAASQMRITEREMR